MENKGRIKQLLFGGFEKCLYPLQKFDSDSERRFAVILERTASKWFRPVKGQFQIYYKLGSDQSEYVPDFLAETERKVYIVETKARGDLKRCGGARQGRCGVKVVPARLEYAEKSGGKAWQYLLIPHDEVNESRRLDDFERFTHPSA